MTGTFLVPSSEVRSDVSLESRSECPTRYFTNGTRTGPGHWSTGNLPVPCTSRSVGMRTRSPMQWIRYVTRKVRVYGRLRTSFYRPWHVEIRTCLPANAGSHKPSFPQRTIVVPGIGPLVVPKDGVDAVEILLHGMWKMTDFVVQEIMNIVFQNDHSHTGGFSSTDPTPTTSRPHSSSRKHRRARSRRSSRSSRSPRRRPRR